MTYKELHILIKDIKYDIRIRQLDKQYHKVDELKHKLKQLLKKVKNKEIIIDYGRRS
jgi:hypothetical protein